MELMDMIALIGFAVTVFIAGYEIGTKNSRPTPMVTAIYLILRATVSGGTLLEKSIARC